MSNQTKQIMNNKTGILLDSFDNIVELQKSLSTISINYRDYTSECVLSLKGLNHIPEDIECLSEEMINFYLRLEMEKVIGHNNFQFEFAKDEGTIRFGFGSEDQRENVRKMFDRNLFVWGNEVQLWRSWKPKMQETCFKQCMLSGVCCI